MAKRDQWVERWTVQSTSNPAKTYTVARHLDGHYGCTCPRWKFARAPKPDCKHIVNLRAELSGSLLPPEPVVVAVKSGNIMAPAQATLPTMAPSMTQPRRATRAAYLELG